MRRRVPLIGAARSSFYDGQAWSEADLSPIPGRQYGRFRIFLVLFYRDGRFAVI
jgi:hypothetical protein